MKKTNTFLPASPAAIAAAAIIRNLNCALYVVTIGKVNLAEAIAMAGDTSKVLSAKNFAELNILSTKIASTICTGKVDACLFAGNGLVGFRPSLNLHFCTPCCYI